MGWSLSCPSLHIGPEGKRNMSAKTWDEFRNSHLGTQNSLSSTWKSIWTALNESKIFWRRQVATNLKNNAVPVELAAKCNVWIGHGFEIGKIRLTVRRRWNGIEKLIGDNEGSKITEPTSAHSLSMTAWGLQDCQIHRSDSVMTKHNRWYPKPGILAAPGSPSNSNELGWICFNSENVEIDASRSAAFAL